MSGFAPPRPTADTAAAMGTLWHAVRQPSRRRLLLPITLGMLFSAAPASSTPSVAAPATSTPSVAAPEACTRVPTNAMCNEPDADCFLYFAYGSNLLAERLHLGSPSARRVIAARASGHRLAFGYWSSRWGGAVATLLPADSANSTPDAWGAVWAVGNEHREALDTQEGVAAGIYEAFDVEVEPVGGGNTLHCRTYRLVAQPPPLSLTATSPQPPNLTPSKIYWQVIVAGARESGLPEEYVHWLDALPHSEYTGGLTVGALAQGLATPLATPSPAPQHTK